jgi:FG-GAP-like repeat
VQRNHVLRLAIIIVIATVASGCAGDGTAPGSEPPRGTPVVYLSGGTSLSSLAALDLVGDGHRDLITTTRGDGSIRVLPGDAVGGFGAALAFAAGDDPVQGGAGDVNGDGIPDLIVIGHLSNSLYLRLGQGNNQFAPPLRYPLRNHGNNFVVTDLNRDGLADVVVSHDGSGQSIYLTAFLGSATGELQPAWELGTTYFTTEGVAAGDFDGDGNTDVAVATGDPGASVLVFHGLGTGQLTAPGVLPPLPTMPGTSDGTSALAVGDLNHDGRDDIVTVDFELTNQLVIRLSTGSGFADPVAIPQPSPVDVALADLNGDRKLDAVAANLDGTVSVLYGEGDGSFQAPLSLSMGPAPASIALADFDGDGLADIAVADLSDNAIRVRLTAAGNR